MTEPQGIQMTIFDLDIWSGRMSPEPLAPMVEKISDASLKKQPKWQTGMPVFLNLRGGGGRKPDVSWETDGQSLGEYMMLNFGECRNVEKGYVLSLISTGTQPERYSLNCGEKPLNPIPTKLSDILETNPDPKYNLSPKACQGILRRAEKRGKELPKLLQETLERQSAFKNVPENLGGARESSFRQSEQEPCQHSITNQSCQGINGDVAGTLDSNYYKGCGERQGTEREVVCYGISSNDSNAMKSPNPHSGIYEADTTRTLDNNGGNPACNQGGMIVLEGNGTRESHKGNGYAESDTMFTLNTVEQHAVCWDGSQTSPTLTARNSGGAQRMPDKGNFTAILYSKRPD